MEYYQGIICWQTNSNNDTEVALVYNEETAGAVRPRTCTASGARCFAQMYNVNRQRMFQMGCAAEALMALNTTKIGRSNWAKMVCAGDYCNKSGLPGLAHILLVLAATGYLAANQYF